jgi:hypothetical protein
VQTAEAAGACVYIDGMQGKEGGHHHQHQSTIQYILVVVFGEVLYGCAIRIKEKSNFVGYDEYNH